MRRKILMMSDLQSGAEQIEIVDAADFDALVDLLREGRNQSYGVMGIGAAKLRALEAWFAKVDALLGSPSAKKSE
jgi:hypothetical protein